MWTILIADDSVDDIFFLSRAFEQSGLDCSLVSVSDGNQAIAYLSKQMPNLLILDLKMPKVGGFEVLQWIKNKPHLHNLPVVVLSSSYLEQDRKRARELGATDYMVKTADEVDLKRIVRDLHSRCSLSSNKFIAAEKYASH